MFGNILKSANKFKDKISEDVTKIGVMITADQKDLSERSELYGSLWEANENVSVCRDCGVRFTPIERKHHCRGCAGIFCENCTKFDISPSSSTEFIRGCEGCLRGECPGDEIKVYIRSILDSKKEETDALNHMKKVGARIGETLGYQQGVPPATALKLFRGSKYGEDGRLVSSIHPLPVSGYLEILNKSSDMMAMKIINAGGDEVFEIPRPSYMALPPGETCHAEFNPNADFLYVLILFNNPNSIPSGIPLIYDTSASGVTTKRISPCAQISKFIDVAIYKISSRGHNVLLKYQPGARLSPRLGNSVSRVGVFSALQGKQFAKNRIDFATNISSADVVQVFRGSSNDTKGTSR